MKESNVPRPNVATAAFVGAVVALAFQLFSGEPLSAESIIAHLVPITGFVVAFFFPSHQKTFAALIGAGLPTLLLIIIGALQGQVVDVPQVQGLLTTVLAVVLTALIPNTKGR